MNLVTEEVVLDFYLKLLDERQVSFVRRDADRAALAGLLVDLKESGIDFHRKITIARRLWKLLFEDAMRALSPDRRGYGRLFEYFDDFVEFEELIFASDSFYRDHTIHSLWVYFLQEYLVREPRFAPLLAGLGSRAAPPEVVELLELMGLQDMLHLLVGTRPAVRCVAALTHDLGYPIKKIGKINRAIAKMAPYFDIEHHTEFRFDFSDVQQHFIDALLTLLATNFYGALDAGGVVTLFELLAGEKRPPKGVEELKTLLRAASPEKRAEAGRTFVKALLFDNRVDHHRYIRRCEQLEQNDHGFMSAYLLCKMLPAFTDAAVYLQEHRHVDEDLHRGPMWDILNAVADHSARTFRISQVAELSDLLTLVDEFEEFSRISRASKNRQYVNEFCRTDLDYRDGYLDASFIFDNPALENVRPEIFFKDKAARLLTLFDVPNLAPTLRVRMSVVDRVGPKETRYGLEFETGQARIEIDGAPQSIPDYLRSADFPAEYAAL